MPLKSSSMRDAQGVIEGSSKGVWGARQLISEFCFNFSNCLYFLSLFLLKRPLRCIKLRYQAVSKPPWRCLYSWGKWKQEEQSFISLYSTALFIKLITEFPHSSFSSFFFFFPLNIQACFWELDPFPPLNRLLLNSWSWTGRNCRCQLTVYKYDISSGIAGNMKYWFMCSKRSYKNDHIHMRD